MSYALNGPANESPLRPDQRFGRYQVEKVLGAGALAVVYRARLQDGRFVALKVLKPAASRQAKLRQLLRNEYELTARLHHPGLVEVFEAGEIDGHPYIAMALVQGPTLEEYLLRHKTLGETASIKIARQIALALDYIHEHGIIHRDLKPANILISNEGRALLFDFGAALNRKVPPQTKADGIYGTPAFLAPEQILDSQAVDGRADLYSLGVILYRMVSGERPFYGSRAELLEAQLHQTPPPPSEYAYVSPQFEALILKALAKDPAQRFQSGAELIAALDAVQLTPPRTGIPQRIFGWLRGAPEPKTDS
jgi:serine/threonine protein kinase